MISEPIYNTNSFYSEGFATKDKQDEKCIKFINCYSEAFRELDKTFQNYTEKPSQEGALYLLDQLKQVKQIRSKFNKSNFISLVPISFKQALSYHDIAFQKMEASASQTLMGEVEENVNEANREIAEESYIFAKNLEATIDLTAVKGDEKLLCTYENTLKEIYKLYLKAVKHGKADASVNMEKTAVTCRLFHEFNDKLSGWHFRYIFNIFVKTEAKFPLSYSDPRLQSLFRFFLQIQNCGGLPEKSQSFVSQYMKLPPQSALSTVILQMAEEIVSSASFQQGKEDFEDNDLYEFQCEKLEFLEDMVKNVQELCFLPAIKTLPNKLKVNIGMANHFRIRLLRYAHNLGISLNERIEWQVDQWMADFRKECLHANIHDPYGSFAPYSSWSWTEMDSIEGEAYLLRRDAKELGLVFYSQSDTPFDHSKVKEKFINVKPAVVKDVLCNTKNATIETEKKITEKKMIEHLLISANAPEMAANFANRLREHMKGLSNIPSSTWDQYFNMSNSDELTQEGARALLYATGYLKT